MKKSTFAHPQGRSTNIFQNGYQIYKIVDVKTEVNYFILTYALFQMDQTYFKVSDNANHGWIASHQPPPENVIYNDEKWDQLISDYISSLKQKLVHAERGLLQALDSENLTPVVFSETPTFEVQQQEFIPQSLNSQVSLASGKNVQTEDIFAVKSSGADRTRNTLAFTSPSKTTPPLNAASVSTLGTSAMRKDRHRDVPSSIPPQKRLKLKSVSFNVDSSGSESSSSASSSETLFDRENEEVNTIETTVSFNRGSRSCLLM